ncbi:MAG TPA: alpha/beta hydrolase [Candidatus Nitrosocosmicus sp.]|nr:alpha/beta hydrolase [Candidatus Nitrosocosmicus sp.]
MLHSDLDNFREIHDPQINQSGILTLLLFHGTGGNENDLIPVAQMICPSASILSPRGKVLENGMARFFKRHAEGVFGLEDLQFRTTELSIFIKEASRAYSFNLNNTAAIGFSNGANIAASLLLLNPEVIKSAILYRAIIPIIPKDLPNLKDKKILLSAGLKDPIVSRDEVIELSKLFQKCGATVTLKWQQSGHNLIDSDITDANEWFSKIC